MPGASPDPGPLGPGTLEAAIELVDELFITLKPPRGGKQELEAASSADLCLGKRGEADKLPLVTLLNGFEPSPRKSKLNDSRYLRSSPNKC